MSSSVLQILKMSENFKKIIPKTPKFTEKKQNQGTMISVSSGGSSSADKPVKYEMNVCASIFEGHITKGLKELFYSKG